MSYRRTRHPILNFFRLVDDFSDGLIEDALVAAQGNVTIAGRYLTLNRTTLLAMIRRKPHLLELLEELRDDGDGAVAEPG